MALEGVPLEMVASLFDGKLAPNAMVLMAGNDDENLILTHQGFATNRAYLSGCEKSIILAQSQRAHAERPKVTLVLVGLSCRMIIFQAFLMHLGCTNSSRSNRRQALFDFDRRLGS